MRYTFLRTPQEEQSDHISTRFPPWNNASFLVVRCQVRTRWLRYISCITQLIHSFLNVFLLRIVGMWPTISKILMVEKIYDQDANGITINFILKSNNFQQLNENYHFRFNLFCVWYIRASY